MSRFNQDPTISQQVTLWNQSGSQVIYGNLLVIPIKESILYVEPLFLRAANGQIPELKRVLVSYGGKVTMQEDLATALQVIFASSISGLPQTAPDGGAATTPSGPTGAADVNALINSAADHYNKAVEAQKRGDWATYGTELSALQDALNQLQAASAATGVVAPAASEGAATTMTTTNP
jgi:hypothetical protein